MSRRYKDKGRIPGQYTAIRWEILDSAAWKQMSMGARLLYRRSVLGMMALCITATSVLADEVLYSRPAAAELLCLGDAAW
jgi:hypothetical protein